METGSRGSGPGDHPHVVPVPAGASYEVRWLTNRAGDCEAKDFCEANRKSKPSLLSLVQQLVANGRVSITPERGHPLKGEKYKGLHVLKPGGYRYFYFREGNTFYLTNGAKKQGRQEPDYKRAKRLRDDFYGT